MRFLGKIATIKGRSRACTGLGLRIIFSRSLRIRGYQVLPGSTDHSRFFGCFGRRLGVKSIEDRGTNEDREKEGDNVHSSAKEEGLPATDGIKSRAIHWILD